MTAERPSAPASTREDAMADLPAPPGPGVIRRVIGSLIADEIAFQRGEDLGAASATWSDEIELTGPEVRADSMEMIALASRVNQLFHLHERGLDDRLREDRSLGAWAATAAEALAAPGAAVTFLTSGSTGAPKACPHDVTDLQQEVAFLARRFADRTRVVATTPPHHIYGFLFTVMLPAALGIPVVDMRGRPATAIRRDLRPGDLVVSFPLGWEQLGRPDGDAPPADVRGTTSTAPCPAAVIEAARDRGFGPITEIYGSSETAGIGVRDEPGADYELMPHWTVASDSAEGAERTLVRVSSGGVRRDTPITLMDDLTWDGERAFRIGGRLDHVVQVGGINVFPDRAAETLRAHPMVKDASVRLMRSDEGARLKAFIVLAEPAPAAGHTDHESPGDARLEELRRELDQWCAERLDAPTRPRAMRFGGAIPRDEQGKAMDWDAFPAASGGGEVRAA